MTEAGLALLGIAAAWSAAHLLGRFTAWLRLPGLIGELLAGVALGATVLGALAPGWHNGLFPGEGLAAAPLQTLSRIGLVAFMFVAGMEVNPAYLRGHGRALAWISSFGLLTPFAISVAAVFAFPSAWQLATGQDPLLLAIAIAAILSISSLPVIARILLSLGLLRAQTGILILTAATLDDLVGLSIFAVLLDRLEPNGSPGWILLMAVGALAGLAVLFRRRLGRTPARGGVTGWAAVEVVIAGMAAAFALEAVGVDASMGAFLAGVIVARLGLLAPSSHERLESIVLRWLTPLYFASIGLRVDFASHFNAGLAGFVLAIACAGKLLGCLAGARLGGKGWGEAMVIAFGLNARGAMGIVLTSAAWKHKLITEELFVALVIMALVTALMSAPAIRLLKRRLPGASEAPEKDAVQALV